MSARMTSFWLRVCETVLLVLAFLLPLAFFLKTYDGTQVKTTLFEAGTVVLAFSWLFKGLERGRWELPAAARPLALPAIALLSWSVLRFALEPYKLAALPGFLKQALCLSTYLIALLEFGGCRNARRLTLWVTGAAWVCCLYAAAQKCGLDPFLWKGAFGGRVFSTFEGPEVFGFFLALCVPLTLTQWLDPERDRFLRWSDLALLLLIEASVLWTGSAGALMALALMSVTCALALPAMIPSKDAVKAGALALGLGAASLVLAARTPGAATVAGGWTAASASWRQAGTTILQSPWTGHGPGSLAFLGTRAGSILLDTTIELGVLGGALWLWLFGALAFAVWRAGRQFVKQGALGESCFSAGLAAATFGFLVAAQFGAGAGALLPGWLLWPLAGTLGGMTLLSRRGTTISVLPIPLGESARRRVYAPALLAFAVLFALPLGWFDSELEQNVAISYGNQRRWVEAIAHFDRVLPGAESFVTAQYLKGTAYLESGRPQQALSSYAAVEALSPYTAAHRRLYYYRAKAYAQLDDWKNAELNYAAAWLHEPDYTPIYAGWAQAAKRTEDWKTAEAAAKMAVDADPQDPEARLALAEIYLKERKVADSQKQRTEAAKLHKELKKKNQG